LAVFNELEEKGIAVVDGIQSTEDLIALAKSLGSIKLNPNGSYVSILRPSKGGNALKGTFSQVHGLSPFPMHTDTAFLGVPVRYLVFGMIGSSPCATTYVHFNEICRASRIDLMGVAKRAVYLSDTFEERKYIGVAFTHGKKNGIRFDSNVMRPMNADAKKFHECVSHILDSISVHQVDWTGNRAVIIDNWKVLHGRDETADEDREILRIYVEN
jgi:hypothetical protein